jgi:transposase-like protein
MTLKAAAAAFSVSPATAHHWWHRWLEGGRGGEGDACVSARSFEPAVAVAAPARAQARAPSPPPAARPWRSGKAQHISPQDNLVCALPSSAQSHSTSTKADFAGQEAVPPVVIK